MTTTAARARALLAAWRAELHRSYVVHGVPSVVYADDDVARDIAELDEVIAELSQRGHDCGVAHIVEADAFPNERDSRKDRLMTTSTQPTWPAEILEYIDGIRERFGDEARVEADDYLKASLPTSKWARFLSDAPQSAEQGKHE